MKDWQLTFTDEAKSHLVFQEVSLLQNVRWTMETVEEREKKWSGSRTTFLYKAEDMATTAHPYFGIDANIQEASHVFHPSSTKAQYP